jgi:hypothetical protein
VGLGFLAEEAHRLEFRSNAPGPVLKIDFRKNSTIYQFCKDYKATFQDKHIEQEK